MKEPINLKKGISIDTPSTALLTRTKTALFEHGLKKTLYLIIRNLFLVIEDYRLKKFDKKFRINTIGDIPVSDLNIDSSNKQYGEGYYSTPFSVIERYFSALPKDLNDYIFVDIGSGKGRILAYASQYNFKKIVGLEFAEDLHAMCGENIRSLRQQSHRCNDFENVLTDASDYNFPDENLVIFMFNPFQSGVFKTLLRNLQQHHEKFSKKIYIGYYNPKYGYLLENSKFLKPVSPEPPMLFVSVHPLWPLAVFESVSGAITDSCDKVM